MSHFLRKNILVLLILFFAGLNLSGQTAEEFRQWGDEAFEQGNFLTASTYYSEALQLDTANLYLWYQLALSSREYYSYAKAYSCFKIVYESDKAKKYPLSLFYMADLSRNLSDYIMARVYYTLFLEDYEKDDKYKFKAEEQLQNIDKIEKLASDTFSTGVEHLTLPVNSPFSEFSGFQQASEFLIFSSVQPLLSNEGEGILSNSFNSAVYISRFTQKGLSRPVLFDEPINSKNEHTANICFNDDYSVAWFNRCEMIGGYKWRCDIYESQYENKAWQRPIKLDINEEGFTSTQPFFYTDTSGIGVLLFTSDRPGGIGGLDLWYSVYKDQEFDTPIHCGSIINSLGDEISPFYDTQERKLYFASDWYYGLGGYDIFYSSGGFSSWSMPKNAGLPYNSAANDFAFNINREDRDGYFTSNREGSYYFKGETCCNDIYAFYNEEKIDVDSLPPDTVVVEYHLKREILDLVPLNLYFHNDVPDPRSRDSLTNTVYDETYYEYVAMIDRYKREYSRGLSGDEKLQAEEAIEIFFLAYVNDGFKSLLELIPLLKEDLEQGSHVTIKIKGFTSPLTDTEYNIVLAKRRINSIINYFRRIDDGVLIPYLENRAPNGGKLTILTDPVGEALSDPFVSDNPNDSRNSVYSIAAARERRIQIVSYESDFAGSRVKALEGAVIHLSKNELNFSLSSDTVFCKTITIENKGDEVLEIVNIQSAQPWVEAYMPRRSIAPGKNVELNICVKKEILTGTALGILILETNSRDAKSVVYVRVVE